MPSDPSSAADSHHLLTGLFFELSNEMNCLADRRGFFTRVNGAWTPTLGWSADELTGQPYLDFVHPDDRPATIAEAARLFSNNYQTVRFENRYRCRDGSYRWLAWYAKFDPASDQLVAAARDVTEQKLQSESFQRQADTIRHMFALQERERKFVSYDIHDGLAQLIVGAHMQVQAACIDLSPIPPALTAARETLQRAVAESRRLINDLRPMVIDEHGMSGSLKFLMADLAKTTNCQFDFSIDVECDRIDPLFDGTVFRIVQEAVTNALRHGRATRIGVSVLQHDDQLHLEIRDNGCGFDLRQVPAERFGVRGIQERAKIFGGQATFDSHRGEGTTIQVRLTVPGRRKAELS